jgi:predicted porin
MKLRLSCAAIAAVTFMAGPAAAADLGGNCCADLEERIAELEATTARKGNRKVSLTVSGWVNEAVFLWDDGVESNAYVGTNSLEQTRVRFLGEAKISEGWSAGYVLEIGSNGGRSSAFSQDGPGSARDLTLRKSSWFLKSKDLGKLTVGQDGTATYHNTQLFRR